MSVRTQNPQGTHRSGDAPSSGGHQEAGASSSLVEVSFADVATKGFFCYMSKRRSEGYRRKLKWLEERMREGLRIRMLTLPERGFIEYMPGERCWRAVEADGYMVIHCLWIVGKSKGKGLSGVLIDDCVEEARRAGMKGVAMATSRKVWLAGGTVLEKYGFKKVDEADPFSLWALKFGDAPDPTFPSGFEGKAAACGDGLTILRSDQCPYIPDATELAVESAAKAGVPCRIVDLNSRDDVMRLSPSPFGVFGLVMDGRLLSYHYLMQKDLLPLLRERPSR